MTILRGEFVPISMQHSRKTRNANVLQCTRSPNEISSARSYVDMTSGQIDENSRATNTSTSTIPNVVTSTTGTSATGNRPGGHSSTSGNVKSSDKGMSKKAGKRPGRKPAKIDERAKLERSRQSAKECRARKKLRYQYLEELVVNREKAVLALKDELEMFRHWCKQLDAGAKVPDSLLKMLASEDVSRHTRQVQHAKRAQHLHQQHEQQRQQQQRRLNYPSGACSSSLMASTQESVAYTDDVSPSNLPNLSPTQPEKQFKGIVLKRQLAFDSDNTGSYSGHSEQQQQQQQQQQQITYQQKMHQQHNAMPSAIFNASNPQETTSSSASQYTPSSQFRSQRVYPQQQSEVEGHSSYVTFPTTTQQQSLGFQSQSLSGVQQQQQQQKLQPHVRFTQQQHGAGEQFSFFNQQNPPVTRIQSEPPMKYMRGMNSSSESQPLQYSSSATQVDKTAEGGYTSADLSLLGLTVSQASSGSLSASSRVRSNSNPAFMTKTDQHKTSPTEGGIVSSLRARDCGVASAHKPKSFSLPNTLFPSSSTDLTQSASNLGLFSGRPLSIVPSVSSITSSELSSAMTMDDTNSYSSDDNNADLPLFQSFDAQSPKRALSDPAINKVSHEVPINTSNTTYGDMAFMQEFSFQKSNIMDPHTKLNNLTTVHCLSSTNTLNTPSPSPFMIVPRNTDSPLSSSPAPSSSMGYPNTTPSSSTTPSPAPLFSLTSFHELTSAEEESAMEVVMSTSSMGSTTATTTAGASPAVMCSETGLSATISEPIPEWYSYLDELEEGGFIPKQPEPEVSVTPVNKFRNVPNFLYEILGDDKDD